ncbi:MAG: hypothetical protein ACM3MB_10925 [Acidobacteriota bacterium]
MVNISELLINGDERIMHYCRSAKEKWSVIIEKHPSFDLDNLSEELSSSQPWFEENCGGQKLGQEIMVTVGIGQFYTSKKGFDSDNLKKARAIYEAFKRSNCSTEIKEEVDKIAADYRLYGK